MASRKANLETPTRHPIDWRGADYDHRNYLAHATIATETPASLAGDLKR